MPLLLSVLVESLDLLAPDLGGLPIHGANIATGALLRAFIQSDRVERLEVFLPPLEMMRTEAQARATEWLLRAEQRGQGRLSFYPSPALPEIWADGRPRVLLGQDAHWLARDRYLRDRFARGPMPLTSDTHALGYHAFYRSLAWAAGAAPVAFDSIVCISEACRQSLARTFDGFLQAEGGRPPCRLDLIPRGVDTDQFQPTDDAGQRAARRELGLPETGQIALFFGRVTPHSKADLLPLLRAFAAASDDAEDRLLIAGVPYPADYGTMLREEAAALGIGDHVIIHAEVVARQQAHYYAAADLFVFPGDAIQESLGGTVLEAMASGLPVIVSDWDGMRDLVVDAVTGLLVQTWWLPAHERLEALSPLTPVQTEFLLLGQSVWVDTPALTSALSTLLRSPKQRAAMGRAGRARVETLYSLPAIAVRWACLWEELSEIAATETETTREARRAGAGRLGLPSPYDHLFAHYATQTLRFEDHSVRLNAAGVAAATGRRRIRFYQEVFPLLRQDVINGLFETLIRNPAGIPLADLTGQVAAETGTRHDDVRYHIGLLLKQDLLDLGSTLSSKNTVTGGMNEAKK